VGSLQPFLRQGTLAPVPSERIQCQLRALDVITGGGPDEAVVNRLIYWADKLLIKAKQNGPQIDVHAVATTLGATVEYAPLSNPAFLLYHPESSRIVVNEHENPEVQRFSIAHECAHIIFRNAISRQVRDPNLRDRIFEWGASAKQEQLCDRFATELLMPTSRASIRANEIPVRGLRLARALADEFGVSLLAALRRLVEIQQPYVIIRWVFAPLPGKPAKLRVVWFARPRLKGVAYIPRHASAPDDSLIASVYTTNRPASGWVDLHHINLGKQPYWLDVIPVSEGVLGVIDLERRYVQCESLSDPVTVHEHPELDTKESGITGGAEGRAFDQMHLEFS
jgi:Zn-dependent peptidase ImmA (M78 family)